MASDDKLRAKLTEAIDDDLERRMEADATVEPMFEDDVRAIVDALLPVVRGALAAAWDDGWHSGYHCGDGINPWREDQP